MYKAKILPARLDKAARALAGNIETNSFCKFFQPNWPLVIFTGTETLQKINYFWKRTLHKMNYFEKKYWFKANNVKTWRRIVTLGNVFCAHRWNQFEITDEKSIQLHLRLVDPGPVRTTPAEFENVYHRLRKVFPFTLKRKVGVFKFRRCKERFWKRSVFVTK